MAGGVQIDLQHEPGLILAETVIIRRYKSPAQQVGRENRQASPGKEVSRWLPGAAVTRSDEVLPHLESARFGHIDHGSQANLRNLLRSATPRYPSGRLELVGACHCCPTCTA